MKNRNIGKFLSFVVATVIIIVVARLWVRFIPSGYISATGLFVVAILLVIIQEAISNKIWPKKKCSSEDEEESASTHSAKRQEVKQLVSTSLQFLIGGAFGFGVVGLILGGDPWFFGSFIVIAIAILIPFLKVPFLQCKETKEELETLKYIDKDERVMGLYYKAASICFHFMFYPLLIFGAVLAEFPPTNFNVVTIGILVILAISAVSFSILFNMYDTGQIDADKLSRPSIILRLLSSIPPILLGIRWITHGLTGVGIAFFVTFVLLTIILLVDYKVRRKNYKV